jgi:hypothetical protein
MDEYEELVVPARVRALSREEKEKKRETKRVSPDDNE